MSYVCVYHRYQGNTPCEDCDTDPARDDDDAQRALTTTDDSLYDERPALCHQSGPAVNRSYHPGV